MSQVGTVNIVNTTICVIIAQLFDSTVVFGRESLVFTIQTRTPRTKTTGLLRFLLTFSPFVTEVTDISYTSVTGAT